MVRRISGLSLLPFSSLWFYKILFSFLFASCLSSHALIIVLNQRLTLPTTRISVLLTVGQRMVLRHIDIQATLILKLCSREFLLQTLGVHMCNMCVFSISSSSKAAHGTYLKEKSSSSPSCLTTMATEPHHRGTCI